MTNRASQLGRSRPSEKLTREDVAALDKATMPDPPAKPPWKNGGGQTMLLVEHYAHRAMVARAIAPGVEDFAVRITQVR